MTPTGPPAKDCGDEILRSYIVHYKQVLGLISGAMALTLIAAQPASAQEQPGGRSESDRASGVIRGEQVLPGRIGGDRADRETQNQPRVRSSRRATRPNPRSAPAATPEQNLAAAQAQLATLGLPCQMTEAALLGHDPQQQAIYEAVCDSGPGYIIIASTPPLAVDCFELAGTAATQRARNPEANVGQQCTLPVNDNSLAVIGGWARDAGVACTIDQVLAVGKSMNGNMIYEVGCSGADGYWLEKTATGWDLQDCMQVASADGVCNFTTAAEQSAGFRTKLAGTDAAGCDVQELRLMGHNANGRFYEARCAANDGFIVRVNTAGVTQQVYPCATAQNIGGGCRLTTAAPAAASTLQ